MNRLLHYLLIIFLFSACGKHFSKQKQDYNHFSLKQSGENKLILDSLARFQKKVSEETNRVIVVSEGELVKDGAETTLGNFVCDALEFNAISRRHPVDVVMLNRGGLRANLPKGNITVTNIFELMPFENEVVLLKVKGAKIKEFASLMPEKKHPFKGLKINVRAGKVDSLKLRGKPIKDDSLYNVVTSDYLANGGDGFVFLKEAERNDFPALKVRDAIIHYCEFLHRKSLTVKPYTDGRLQISK